jgi:NADPH:quinone reductase-like Zn-dependent oxidoreductase
MKALRLHGRGGPEQLFFEDAPMPTPSAGEARVRVCAAGITPAELTWDETHRAADGRERLPSIPGHDVSGFVEALGPDASGVKIGQEVFGLIDFPRDGSAAEYVNVPAADLAPKPEMLNHIYAAAVPLSALTAWQALFDHAHLSAGNRILIHGAAGGVGAFAVQLANLHRAEVIATCSAQHARFVRKLGADKVIDYQTSRFEEIARNVDIVLDPIGGETRERSWQTLREGGTLVTLPGPIPETPPRRQDVKGVFFVVGPNRTQLIRITDLIDQGMFRPFVETTYLLSEGRRAFERALAGHLSGKIVLQVME